ncbi:MAG TPA: glycosyltransferase family 2 protein, partial [Candidatus Atribacteria bacterium]|nr:glycosyltransferase family 2 protein [Candidatus Atribacteria bacterium]
MIMKSAKQSVPKVSIIVLNYNGIEDTIICLNSLLGMKYPNYEIIVVDNGSENDEAKRLSHIYGTKITLIRNECNLGYAEGNNVGIRFALSFNPAYVLILNNDIKVHPLFLNELVNVCEKDKKIGIVGPKMYDMDRPDVLFSAGGKINFGLGLHMQFGQGKTSTGKYNLMKEVDFVNGACMLIRREVIEKIGTFPTEYFLQWEDI